MRALLATCGAAAALLAIAPPQAVAQPPAQTALQSALSQGMQRAGSSSGAYVVDLSTRQRLFSARAGTGRLPASVEKVYTSSTALLRFGANSSLTTSVLGQGTLDPSHTWNGTLYLKGGGDPTFGSAAFDHAAYGTGATVQRLVSTLIRRTGIHAVHGRIVGDGSYFDSRRGTPATGYRPSTDVEGLLGALAYDRGFATWDGSVLQTRPALVATQQLATALRAARVTVPRRTPLYTGRAPAGLRLLATVHSPRIGTLIKLTNTPSDNYLAEMLLKGLGARFGGAGTTAAGAAVVRAELASTFGVHPHLDDGSGLSRADSTSPREVVKVLAQLAGNATFVGSLALGGETGTLEPPRMSGTAAQGRCRGKTGSLHDVSNLVGYCKARDGHTLAFAFLMNGVSPSYARPIQDRMAVALAKYNG